VFLDGRAVLDRSWVKASLDELVRSEPRQKRRYIRVRTDWVVQATAGGQEAELRVKDLSVTGARLESKEPYAVGETLQLQLDTMRVEAEVRRLTQHGLGYTLGVRFKSSDPQTQQLLNLVRKLCS
jgi:hypothetical protein